jgi:hypothetical protein
MGRSLLEEQNTDSISMSDHKTQLSKTEQLNGNVLWQIHHRAMSGVSDINHLSQIFREKSCGMHRERNRKHTRQNRLNADDTR